MKKINQTGSGAKEEFVIPPVTSEDIAFVLRDQLVNQRLCVSMVSVNYSNWGGTANLAFLTICASVIFSTMFLR